MILGEILLDRTVFGSKPGILPINFWDFSEISDFHQLSPARKNIYTCPIKNILGVLKSYESVSFISTILGA